MESNIDKLIGDSFTCYWKPKPWTEYLISILAISRSQRNFTPKCNVKQCVKLHHVKMATASTLYFPFGLKISPIKKRDPYPLIESVVPLVSNRSWSMWHCISLGLGQKMWCHISSVHWDICIWRPFNMINYSKLIMVRKHTKSWSRFSGSHSELKSQPVTGITCWVCKWRSLQIVRSSVLEGPSVASLHSWISSSKHTLFQLCPVWITSP